MGPKEYKDMVDYLTRVKGIKDPFVPASAIERPPRVLEMEAILNFKDRNPEFKADGGRIGFAEGLPKNIRLTPCRGNADGVPFLSSIRPPSAKLFEGDISLKYSS